MLTQSTAGQSAGPTPAGLVLERLPSGDYAWLRPELDAAPRDAEQLGQNLARTLGWPEPRPEPEDTRWTITQAGRDYLARQRAMAALFGPWPMLSEVPA